MTLAKLCAVVTRYAFVSSFCTQIKYSYRAITHTTNPYSSFIGVILVSLSDNSSSEPAISVPPPDTPISTPPTAPERDYTPSNPLLGDALALLSALFYAIYVTLLKVRIGDESRIDMQLFFGFVGLFNIVVCWPVGLVLHLTGAEVFEWPEGGRMWGAILINVSLASSPLGYWASCMDRC